MFEKLCNEIKSYVESWPLEQKLLNECMRAWHSNDISALKKYDWDAIDWRLFFKLIDHHKTNAIVYDILKRLDREIIPGEVTGRLKAFYKQNAFHSLKLSAETVYLVSAFKKARISSIVLKGAPLAQMLYGDVSLRHSRDIDILIHLDDMVEADQIVRKLGYKPDLYDFKSFSPKQSEFYFSHRHHQNYCHPGKGIILELHWKPISNIYCNFYNRQLFFNSACSLRMGNTPVLVFNKSTYFIHLCIHGSFHCWNRLKWLYDIFLLSHHFTDNEWEAIWYQARKGRVLTLVVQACILIHVLYGKTFSFDNFPKVHYQPLKRLVFWQLRSMDSSQIPTRLSLIKLSLIRIWIQMLCNPGMKSKVKYILSIFRPVPTYFNDHNFSDRFFCLYYPMRMGIMLRNNLRKIL